MRFNKTLGNKFSFVGDKQTEIRKPAVSATLRAFLQTQSERLENLLTKKKLHSQKLHRISSQNLQYRDQLKQKIQQTHKKHEKNRKQFLDKRVKNEKFKMQQVERKRGELFDKIKSARKSNQQNFRKTKTSTIEFWNNKDYLIRKAYESQTSVAPLHEDAVEKKKIIQRRSQIFGETSKDQLLSRHSEIVDRIQSMVANKQKLLDEYNRKLEKGFEKNINILQKKQQKFVNDICFHQKRSQSLLKEAQRKYKKKMEGRAIDFRDNIDRVKQNFTERNTKRAKSMKDCRCHKKGIDYNSQQSPQEGLSKSINFNNEQQHQEQNNQGKSSQRKQPWQKQTLKNFMVKSQVNLSNVKTNKEVLQQKQDLRDERKLMTEREISNSIKVREEIKNESNLQVRQARVLA